MSFSLRVYLQPQDNPEFKHYHSTPFQDPITLSSQILITCI